MSEKTVYLGSRGQAPQRHPIKLTSGMKRQAAAVAEIQKTAGQLDVVIANAGIAKHHGSLTTAPLSEFRDHWEVNTRTHRPLPRPSTSSSSSPTGAPKFAYITSARGPSAATQHEHRRVRVLKGAANYLVKALDAENPSLVTLAISPGWVGRTWATGGCRRRAPASAATKKESGRFWKQIETGGKPWEVASTKFLGEKSWLSISIAEMVTQLKTFYD
ncbi:hypothetical protein B0H14DRAFT_3491202 [Mycena olivaceomarginata]|nr:hypothetical protein B0H14DRAFT_3491202 [Mycena olivaceomarginata]